MSKVNGIEFVDKQLPSHKRSLKATYPMEAKGFTLHNTYNDASAMNEIAYMQDNNNKVSYTYAIDNLRIVKGLPLDRNGWHAGDGTNGYGNRNTWGVEICYSKSGGERYDKAETNTIKFVAYRLYQLGWGVSKVWKHKDWSGKNCPHRILARSRGWEGIIKAIDKELKRLKGSSKPISGKTSKPNTSKPSVSTPAKGIDTLAREVIAGKHGNGEDRKKSLGSLYSDVQKRVNELSNKKDNTKTPAKGIDTLAREVIAGKHGNGEDRKESLGSLYSQVQKRVNELQTGTKQSKSIDQLVRETLKGLHGNGEDRKKSLGSNYSSVQSIINKKYK